MLMRIRNGSLITKGDCIRRFLSMSHDVYDAGEVKKCNEEWIEVDFLDTVARFLISDISYVVDTTSDHEYYMTLETGTLLDDCRSAPNIDETSDDPVLVSFMNLLKRI